MKQNMKDGWKRLGFAGLLTAVLVACSIYFGQAAVSNIAGIAVKQTTAATGGFGVWNDVIDGAIGVTGVTKGILATALYVSNGVDADYVQSNGYGAIRVDNTVVSSPLEVFSVVKLDLSTSAVAYDFAFDASVVNFSRKVQISTPSGNTGFVCVNFQRTATVLATATCPAANTASTTAIVLDGGEVFTLHDFAASGVSVIGSAASQGVSIKAWSQ